MKLVSGRLTLPSLLIALLSSSCAGRPALDTVPSLDTADEGVIVVTAPDGCNSFLVNAGVCLSVELVSDTPVIISENGIEIYEFVNEEWIPVDDTNYASVTFIVSPSDSFIHRSFTLMPHPLFGVRTDPVTVRFIVIGNLYHNEIMGEEVSAHVDVILYP